ncbi:MAG: hypothetical protein LWW86_10975 [Micrococcales bacterium]|nr:hypothetical protein [Micrococcales bacterium]
MGLFSGLSGRREQLSPGVREALGLASGERLLAWATEDGTGRVVAATNHRLVTVTSGAAELSAAWHEISRGSWSQEAAMMSVFFADDRFPVQWRFDEGEPRLLLQTIRERVQASVVLAQEVNLGPQQVAQTALRKDLATGEISEQTVLGKGARRDDPELAMAVRETLDALREQIGID